MDRRRACGSCSTSNTPAWRRSTTRRRSRRPSALAGSTASCGASTTTGSSGSSPHGSSGAPGPPPTAGGTQRSGPPACSRLPGKRASQAGAAATPLGRLRRRQGKSRRCYAPTARPGSGSGVWHRRSGEPTLLDRLGQARGRPSAACAGGDSPAGGRQDAGHEVVGEFNWSSQHLDDEVLRCRDGNGDGQTGRVGLRCVHLVGRRQRGVRSSNGSGRRSRGGCRVRMPLCPVACRRPWVVVGSVRAVVCRRSAWRPDRLVTCPLRSGKRSRSCELRAPGCVTLPVGSGEPRRRSRESYVATRRLGAAVWRSGRRRRSGTAPDVPSARRSPSWPRTIG